MWWYFYRRVVSVGPTLFGVVLLTFALAVGVHRPGGDRSGFDALPLFFNPEPQDLEGELIEFGSAETLQQRQLEDLSTRGRALIPAAVPLLDRQDIDKKRILLVLSPWVEAYAGPLGISEQEDPVAFWKEVYQAHRLDFRQHHVHRLIGRIVDDKSDYVTEQLGRLGTYSFEGMFTALSAKQSLPVQKTIVDTLQSIRPELKQLCGAYDTAICAEILDEWWFVHRSEFVVFGELERFFALVSETQFFKWMTRVLTLRLGLSSQDGLPISSTITQHVQLTLCLVLLALVLAIVVAIPLGVWLGLKDHTIAATAISMMSWLVYAVPVIWVAVFLSKATGSVPGSAHSGSLQEVLSNPLHWLLQHSATWLAASIAIGYPQMVVISRHQRSSILDAANAEYVRAAKAKGISEIALILRHVLRNSMPTVVHLLGVQLPLLVGAAVVIEYVFALPGIGHRTLVAVRDGDAPWILALTVFSGLLVVMGGLAAEVGHAALDPRARRFIFRRRRV